jgi:TolA-binding protein
MKYFENIFKLRSANFLKLQMEVVIMFTIVSRRLIIFLVLLLFACSGKKGVVIEGEKPDLILENAIQLYHEGKYDQTMQYCQYILDNFPTTDLHIDTQLLMAQTLGAQEKFEEQMDLLLRVLKENIIPERIPQIYIQIGQFYEHAARWNPGNVTSDTLDMEQAIKYYRKAVSYPNSEDRSAKAAALYRIGLLNAKINEMELAKNAYQQVITSFPDSPYSILAKTKLLDPANTAELALPSPGSTATAGQQAPAPQPETGGEQQFKELITPHPADTTHLKTPTEDLEKPVYSDSTQNK